MTRFTPDKHPCNSLYDACREDTPSLVHIDNAYGSGSAVIWLVARLTETAAFTGIGENLNDLQTIRCAQKMRQLGYHITVSEMMAFFEAFENGEYEQFKGYNRPNPQIILKSFAAFMSDLFVERANAEGEKDAIREAEERELARKTKVECPPELAKRIEKLYRSTRYQLPERDRRREKTMFNQDKK